MGILSKLPERLKELMLEKGLNPPTLAKEVNIVSNLITRYLRGEHTPQFDNLIALADYFDCSVDFLLGLTEYPKREGQIFKKAPPFSVQFRTAMKKCNVSQYALQKKTGISWSSFHKWLHGYQVPYPDSLIKMATVLECSVDFLIGRED